MIQIVVDGKVAKECSGLEHEIALGGIVLRCTNNREGLSDSLRDALSKEEPVRVELSLDSDVALNKMVKLAPLPEGDWQLFTSPVPETQGGWSSH